MSWDEAVKKGMRTVKGDWVSFTRGTEGVVIAEAMGFTRSINNKYTVHTTAGVVSEDSILETRGDRS